jgi:hypothetical protein
MQFRVIPIQILHKKFQTKKTRSDTMPPDLRIRPIKRGSGEATITNTQIRTYLQI